MDIATIRQWAASNAKGLMPDTLFKEDEIDHISMCMEHIYKWYHENYPIGHFLSAVVRNDFRESCFHSDDTNRKALYLYALFLANKIPSDYIDKALGKIPSRKS
jgi:hypothetical protein